MHAGCVFLPHTEVLSSRSIKITFRAAKTQITGTHPKVPDSESAVLTKSLSGENAAASGPHSETGDSDEGFLKSTKDYTKSKHE